MIIFKNFFSFGLTFKAYDWLIVNGTKATPLFNALGAVQVVVCVLSVPMCMSYSSPPIPPFEVRSLLMTYYLDILGKRNRSFFYRHDILRMIGLK